MKNTLLLALFVSLFTFVSISAVRSQCNHSSDYTALRALYLSTDGDNWLNNTNWPTAQQFQDNTAPPSETNMSTWFGITCTDNRVTKIDIENNRLKGTLPPEIGNLSNLTTMELGDNLIYGCIPQSYINLCPLADNFDLDNDLLPWEGNEIQFCSTDGSLQAQVGTPCDDENAANGQDVIQDDCSCAPSNVTTGDCAHPDDYTALRALYLSTDGDNWLNNTNWPTAQQFQDNTTPPSETNMSTWFGITCTDNRVTKIDIENNRLKGTLPPEIGNLSNLTKMELGDNLIYGCIPQSYINLCPLADNFDLDNDLLPWEGNEIQFCSTDGSLQAQVGTPCDDGNAANGQDVIQDDCSCAPSNVTTGDCAHPDDYTALRALYLSTDGDNWLNNTNWPTAQQFQDNTTPPSETNMSTWFGITCTDNRVTKIDIENNRLKGTLPPQIGNLSNLTKMELGDNLIYGCIPQSYINLCPLADNFDLDNDLLPWEGNEIQFCSTDGSLQAQVGMPCDDGNAANGQDVIQDDCSCAPSNVTTGDCAHPDDYTALRALYLSTDGDNWLNNTNWPTAQQFQDNTTPPSETNMSTWFGITCTDNRVTKIDIENNRLKGTLPPQIGNLSNLTKMELGDNLIYGCIPQSYINLCPLADNFDLDNDLLPWEGNEIQFCSTDGSLQAQVGMPCDDGNAANGQDVIQDDCSCAPSNVTTGDCAHPDDYTALRALYLSTDGDNWLNNTNWPTAQQFQDNTTPPSETNMSTWFGITCTDNRVTKIDIENNRLKGTLPPQIGNLSNLTKMELGDNLIYGCIPQSYINLCPLADNFDLDNDLLPWEGNEIQFCSTDGSLQAQVGMPCDDGNAANGQDVIQDDCSCAPSNVTTGDCAHPDDYTALRALYLSTDGDNWLNNTNWPTAQQFQDNTTPPSETNMSTWFGITCTDNRVTKIDIENNRLKGTLPPQIGNLSNLTKMELGDNLIYGCIPQSYINLCPLADNFDLDNDLLPWEGNEIQFCSTDGSLQAQVGMPCDDGNAANGQDVIQDDCSCAPSNVTTGDCAHPDDYTALRALYLSTDGDNWLNNTNWPTAQQFQDNTTPPSETNMSTWFGITCTDNRVTKIDIENNRLKGTLPPQIGNLSNLTTMELGDNLIYGCIPQSYINLCPLADNFDLDNDLLPWEGNEIQFCSTDGSLQAQVGMPCDDGNAANGQDVIQDDCSCAPSNVTTGDCAHPDDYTALRALYLSTDGDNWLNNTNWPTAQQFQDNTTPPSETNMSTWFGITCTDNRVTKIDIENNRLKGTLPPEIGNLSNLTKMELGDNLIYGCIPQSYINLCPLADNFDLDNDLLPWEGNEIQFCSTDGSLQAQVGTPCDDENAANGQDVIQDDCSCAPLKTTAAENNLIHVEIAPNPVEDLLFLELNQMSDRVDYSIVGILGKTLINGSFQHKTHIDMSKLTAGTYFLILKNIDNNFGMYKLTKLQ